jgi:hypothetical protein
MEPWGGSGASYPVRGPAGAPRQDGVRSVGEPEGFREFVLARYAALVRLGTLLTGDLGHGEDLVQGSLVKTFRARRRLHPHGDAEAYTRTVMARAAWRATGPHCLSTCHGTPW